MCELLNIKERQAQQNIEDLATEASSADLLSKVCGSSQDCNSIVGLRDCLKTNDDCLQTCRIATDKLAAL